MNRTQNYDLNQWEKSDKVLMDDFNADNAKIDGALAAKADASALATLSRTVSGHTSALNQKGNCSIGFFTYEGTGTCGYNNPTRITFPRMPAAFIVMGPEGVMIGRGGQSWASFCVSTNSHTGVSTDSVTWSGSTAAIAHHDLPEPQMNKTGTHLVICFYAES